MYNVCVRAIMCTCVSLLVCSVCVCVFIINVFVCVVMCTKMLYVFVTNVCNESKCVCDCVCVCVCTW
jgi:hypothetical protein